VSVNRTFPAVPNDVREWTRFLQGLFFAREFDAELSGCTTTPDETVRYTVSAGIVCMLIPDLVAVSNTTAATLTSLPREIRPTRAQQCLARIVENSVTAVGLVQIGTDGTVTLFADLDGGAFTAAGNKGIKSSVITFLLD
jgi:hypothetical protein